jgi:hypothetical protein
MGQIISVNSVRPVPSAQEPPTPKKERDNGQKHMDQDYTLLPSGISQRTAFITNGSGRIQLQNTLSCQIEITSPSSFITQTPDNDTGMIDIPLNRALYTTDKGIFPTPIMGQSSHGFHPMSLNIGFVTNVHAIEIREFVKGTVRRIMAGAN